MAIDNWWVDVSWGFSLERYWQAKEWDGIHKTEESAAVSNNMQILKQQIWGLSHQRRVVESRENGNGEAIKYEPWSKDWLHNATIYYVIMYYIPILEDGHQDHQAINRNLYDVYPHS